MSTPILPDVCGGLAGTHTWAASGQHMDGWHMDGWGMGGAGGWGGWLGLLFMVAFALLLAVVVLAFVRVVLLPVLTGTEPREGGDGGADDALTVLRERYASGDIDREEYEERAAVLRDAGR